MLHISNIFTVKSSENNLFNSTLMLLIENFKIHFNIKCTFSLRKVHYTLSVNVFQAFNIMLEDFLDNASVGDTGRNWDGIFELQRKVIMSQL